MRLCLPILTPDNTYTVLLAYRPRVVWLISTSETVACIFCCHFSSRAVRCALVLTCLWLVWCAAAGSYRLRRQQVLQAAPLCYPPASHAQYTGSAGGRAVEACLWGDGAPPRGLHMAWQQQHKGHHTIGSGRLCSGFCSIVSKPVSLIPVMQCVLQMYQLFIHSKPCQVLEVFPLACTMSHYALSRRCGVALPDCHVAWR